MANPQHIAWLREGVQSWNDRRRRAFFDADLSSEDVSLALGGHGREDIRQISVNLRGINLSCTNLRNATLRDTDLSEAFIGQSDLSNADLRGSVFKGSTLFASSLRNAKLTSTTFANARFWLCDLSLAQFVASNLEATQLWGCNLAGTHLYNAVVKDTEIVASKPWEARLYWPPERVDSPNVSNQPISRISDLLERCRDLRSGHTLGTRLYFRGEPQSGLPLSPTLMRKPILRSVEADMLTDLMIRQPDSFHKIDTVAMEWVFGRHHGLPTRVLDITRNPLVALYFACASDDEHDGCLHVFAVPKQLVLPFNSGRATYIASFAKLSRKDQDLLLGKELENAEVGPEISQMNMIEQQERYRRAREELYSLIEKDSPYLAKRMDWRNLYRVFVLEPQRTFERLKAQSGAFLISAFHERFEQSEIAKWNGEIPVYCHRRLVIPSERKQHLLDDLQSLNITRETLFPGVDEAAHAISQDHLGRSS